VGSPYTDKNNMADAPALEGVGVPMPGAPPAFAGGTFADAARAGERATLPELELVKVPAAVVEAAGLRGEMFPLVPFGADAAKFSVSVFVAVGQYDWQTAEAMTSSEAPHVKMALLKCQAAVCVRVPAAKPVIFIMDVGPDINPHRRIAFADLAAASFDVDGAAAEEEGEEVIVQGTRAEVEAALVNAREHAIIGATRGNVLVEASGVLRAVGPNVATLPSMPLAAFTAATATNTWANLRFPTDVGTVQNRLSLTRALQRRFPNLRLRVSGLSCRAFVAEGWTHEMKEAVLEMGFRTVFVEGRLPKRAGVTEGVLEKERAATAGEHEAAKKACDEARAEGKDVRILAAEAPGEDVLRRLGATAAKIGEILATFGRAACALVRVTNPSVPDAGLVRVGAFALSKAALRL
jgi:hypothetical protein